MNIPKFEIAIAKLEENEVMEVLQGIIQTLVDYFGFSTIYNRISITTEKTDHNPSQVLKEVGVLDLGATRIISDSHIKLILHSSKIEFLPFILVREALYCFLPPSSLNNNAVKLFVNHVVEIFLATYPVIERWKRFIREQIIDETYFKGQYDRIKDFLMLQNDDQKANPIIFSFEYIRESLPITKNNLKQEELYNVLFREYSAEVARTLYDETIIEALRVFITIFSHEKVFNTLGDYKTFFQKYTQNGTLETFLSLREFIHALRWIRKYTYIGPSYHVDWNVIGIKVLPCSLTFTPSISSEPLYKFIGELPFMYQPSFSKSDFSIKVFGWFVIPKQYISDLLDLLHTLKKNGYLIEYHIIEKYSKLNFLNLNYFRKRQFGILDIDGRDYNPTYEITFSFTSKAPKSPYPLPLTPLDFIILDRIRYFAITGFSLEQSAEGVKTIKHDLFNHFLLEKQKLNRLKHTIQQIRDNQDALQMFKKLTHKYGSYGFFDFRAFLSEIEHTLEGIMSILKENKILSFSQLRRYFISKKDTIKFNKDRDVKRFLFSTLLPIYFTDRNEYRRKRRNVKIFYEYLCACEDLKIYNLSVILKIVQDNHLPKTIFLTKQQKLENSYNLFEIESLTARSLQQKLYTYLSHSPPLIYPLMISTLSVRDFARYLLKCNIKTNPTAKKQFLSLKPYFPRIIYNEGNNLESGIKYATLTIWLPNLDPYEKFCLLSLIFNTFGENLIGIRRFFFDGFFDPYTRKNFYDFEKNRFFYTKDLFGEYHKYARKLFGDPPSDKIESKHPSSAEALFWDKTVTKMGTLIARVKDRLSREQRDFNMSTLHTLQEFNRRLAFNLSKPEKYFTQKEEGELQQYINTLYLIPNYQKFGLSQYMLYIKPEDLAETDFKLLLLNTFKSIRYPGYIESSKSLLISYLFPYNTPNDSYLNWIAKSKKSVSEYCLFEMIKVYRIFQFDRNISLRGWELNAEKFKVYYENILSTPVDEKHPVPITQFEIGNQPSGTKYTPSSPEFRQLADLYQLNENDLKYTPKKHFKSELRSMSAIIKKRLVFPYVAVKKLRLIERLHIVLCGISRAHIHKVVEIFSFFNVGMIYEIKGHYYMKDILEEKQFERGLYITLHLPDCDLAKFMPRFHELFGQLKIDHYLILNDLIDGTSFLNHIYDEKDLNEYNPFLTLKWNDKDKIFMNTPVFGENFKKLYPKLL